MVLASFRARAAEPLPVSPASDNIGENLSMTPEPLPFRLSLAGEETIDSRGVRSVSYKVQGLLHLEGDTLALEWAVDRSTESVGLGGISTDVKQFEYEELVVPLAWLTEVRLTGGLLRPWRLHLHARRLDAFDGVPAARPGRVTLKIRRRNRQLATAMFEAIEEARAYLLEYTDPGLLTDGETPSGGSTYP